MDLDMISIIICSRKHEISKELSDNIKDTIGQGIRYEIVLIDNSDNRYSIFTAYDEGVKRAKYEFLCFMHEDILFHSENWGRICIKQMNEDRNVGLLGVIGSQYLSRCSPGWVIHDLIIGQIIQGRMENGRYMTSKHLIASKSSNEIVAVDGLWMFTRKSMFDATLQWDTINYQGFHYYDIDISMQVIQTGYKIELTDIWIEHKSMGAYNESFWDNFLIFSKKWNQFLPVQVSGLTKKQIDEYDNALVAQIRKYNLMILSYQSVLKKLGYYDVFIPLYDMLITKPRAYFRTVMSIFGRMQ